MIKGLFADYSNARIQQNIFSSEGEALWYPFLGILSEVGIFHSYDTKLEWMPWKFAGFEAGFGLQFSPTVISASIDSSYTYLTGYYQMELYPLTANVQLLMPIAPKRRWIGIKAGFGALLTHAYMIYSYDDEEEYKSYYGENGVGALPGTTTEDFTFVGQKYGETFFINYMLTAGAFLRLVSYHGMVFDFSFDYVYWNIADYSLSNIVANFSLGFKI